MNAIVVGVGTFIIACLLVVAYMCLCLTVSAKDRVLMLTSDGNAKTLLPVSELPCIQNKKLYFYPQI